MVGKGRIEVSNHSSLALLVGIGIEGKGTNVNCIHCSGVEVDGVFFDGFENSMQRKFAGIQLKQFIEIDGIITCVGEKERDRRIDIRQLYCEVEIDGVSILVSWCCVNGVDASIAINSSRFIR